MREHLRLVFLGALVVGIALEALTSRLAERHVVRQAEQATEDAWWWDLEVEES